MVDIGRVRSILRSLIKRYFHFCLRGGGGGGDEGAIAPV